MGRKMSVDFSSGHPYETSKNYKRLWQLLQVTPVICFARVHKTYVCATSWSNGVAKVSMPRPARTLPMVDYIEACEREKFIEECGKANLEFIDVPAGSSFWG